MSTPAQNFTRTARAEGHLVANQPTSVLPRTAFTVTEIAGTALPLSEWAIRRLIRGGHLKARFTGRQYLITPQAIDDYLTSAD
jgi:excisionase family DNA binding protein